MSSAGEANEGRAASSAPPTAEQLTTSRAARWHQDGQALLTLEGLRDWLKRGGLVAYGPRAGQLGAPAGSLVEATLGKKLGDVAELEGAETARTLLARLVAEGSAVPLNLLGASGGLGTDQPDFLASAAVFSYVFTLRGNKAWKQAPATSGAVKVSPLALAVYEMVVAKVTMSSYDLATQLGKEVTEGAVLRALTELWGQLRVLPVVQLDGSATLWELTTARFTKQIKAGANAGQPSALSALISLYLEQAVAATEDEIETFLSPLAARSRVRDVVHALMGARQLETVVVEGKTLLHVTGELPGFAAAVVAEPVAEGAAESVEGSGSRISKFASKPGGKLGTGLRSKPSFGKKVGFGGKPAFGARPAFGTKNSGPRTPVDRERRPFRRDDGVGATPRPRFDKPWSEDRKPNDGGQGIAASAGEGGETSRPKRVYAPGAGNGDGAKRTFSKPGTFGRKREGFGGGAERGEGRPPRKEFGAGQARPQRREFEAGEGRATGRAGAERPAGGGFKRTGGAAGSYTPRPKPAFGGKFGAKPYAGKPSFGQDGAGASGGGEAPRKVYRKFDAPREKPGKSAFGVKPFDARPASPRKFGDAVGGDRPARSSDRPRTSDRARGEGADRSERPRASFGAKPGGFAGKSGSGGGRKPFAKAGGPFAKFAEGKKPFRKPGPGTKSAGGRGESGSGGGYSPVKRKRPEGSG